MMNLMQCKNAFKNSMLRPSYVIVVMHIYMLKRLYQQNQRQQNQKMLIKKVIFKNMLHLLIAISEINNAQSGNAKAIDVVMTIYNLIEQSNNCSKTSGSLW